MRISGRRRVPPLQGHPAAGVLLSGPAPFRFFSVANQTIGELPVEVQERGRRTTFSVGKERMALPGLAKGIRSCVGRGFPVETHRRLRRPRFPLPGEGPRPADRSREKHQGNQKGYPDQCRGGAPVHGDSPFPPFSRIESSNSFARAAIGLNGSFAMKRPNCSAARSTLPSFIREIARLNRA